MKIIFRFLIEMKLFVFIILILGCVSSQEFIKLTNCPENYTTYEPRDFILIKPIWTNPNNQNLLLNYNWKYKILKTEKFNNSEIIPSDNLVKQSKNNTQKLIIPNYTLEPGFYIISVTSHKKTAVEKPTSVLENYTKNCYIEIKAYKPHADIAGGIERSVFPNEDIVLNGEQSFSRNVENKNLSFEWTCSQETKAANFCTDEILSVETRFIIPAEHVVDNQTFVVVLKVSDGFESKSESQKIYVNSHHISLEINCLENCHSVSNFPVYTEQTIFEVDCIKNCKSITNYNWTIINAATREIISTNNKEFMFVIDDQISTTGNFYISVQVHSLEGLEGSAITFLNYDYNAPEVTNCKIIPETGHTLITKFHFFCNQTPTEASNIYEFYLKDFTLGAKRLVTRGLYLDVIENKFLLPESKGRTFFLKITQTGAPTLTIGLEAYVTSLLKQKKPLYIRNYLRYFYGGKSPRESLIQRFKIDREEAFMLYQALIEELVANKNNEYLSAFIQEITDAVAHDLLNIPIKSVDEMIKISYSCRLLQSLSETEDVICSKLSDKISEFLDQRSNSKNIEKKVEILIEDALNCLESGDSILTARKVVSRKHKKPTEEEDDEIEHSNSLYEDVYDKLEDYEETDENYFKQIEDKRNKSTTVIKKNLKLAKLLGLTLKSSHKLVKKKTATLEQIIYKNKGIKHARKSIKGRGISIQGSDDFSDNFQTYYLLFYAYFNDFLQWNSNKINVSTNILSYQYWDETGDNQIIYFAQPVHIKFEITKNFVPKIYTFTLEMTHDYNKLSDFEMNYEIRVHRLFLERKRRIRVEFHNLDEDDIYNVVIVKDEFPTLEHFAKNQTISLQTNQYLNETNDSSHLVIIYIGILVHDKIKIKKDKYIYHISSVESACIAWDFQDYIWRASCKIGSSNNSFILCDCNEVNLLAGYMKNTLPVIQKVVKPDLEMTLHSCYIIFIATLTTFGLYLFLIIFTLLEKKMPIYFLADNLAEDLFAYLIHVKTGLTPPSGTTSSIVIKLKGDIVSKPHVLNYPDPNLKILQGGSEELFVLTTQKHLGNLKQIHLWFDSTGTGPSWFCRSITVYDMQTRQEWYFRVYKMLALRKNVSHLIINRHELDLSENNTMKFSTQIKYHSWAVWLREPTFSRFKKLTILLSNILLIYVANLVTIGIPRLELQDGFDLGEHSHYRLYVFTAISVILSTLFIFIIHITIAWSFRLSTTQLMTTQFFSRLTTFCWTFIIASIFFSISFLVMFGYFLPIYKSLLWLVLSICGLIIQIFIYEYLFLLLQENYFRFQISNNIQEKISDIWKNIEQQRLYLYSKFGPNLLRPYFRRQYKPLQPKQIKIKQFKLLTRLRVIKDLKELLFFSIYTIILYSMLIMINDEDSYYVKKDLENLVRGFYTRTLDFYSIHDHPHFDRYLMETFLPNVHPIIWYGKSKITVPQLMIDKTSKLMGVVRLRQHRAGGHKCRVPKIMNFTNMTCTPNYLALDAEVKDFGYSWNPNKTTNKLDKLKHVWTYTSASETKATRFYGLYSTYPGGGYISYLGRNLKNTKVNLKYLLKHHWVDEKSCAVFIEFLTYNCNFNMFSSVRLLIEQTATGYVNQIISIDPVRMLYNKSRSEDIMIAFCALFALVVMMLLVKEFVDVVQKFHFFRHNIWMLLDILITIQSLLFIICYITRFFDLKRYLKHLENRKVRDGLETLEYKNNYFQYFGFFTLEENLTILSLTLIVSATLRLWRFLRFGTRFRIFEKTIQINATPAFHIILAFQVVLYAFGSTMRMIAGNQMRNLCSFRDTQRTLISMIFGANEINTKNWQPFYLSAVALVGYILAARFFVLLILAVILFSYGQALIICSSDIYEYNLKDFILEQFNYLPKFIRYKFRRQKGGTTNVHKIEPKNERIYYKKCTSVSSVRIRCMKMLFQRLIVKKSQDLFNINVMLSVLATFMFERISKHDVFFIRKYKNRTKLLPEYRLKQIAFASNSMLEDAGSILISTESTKDKSNTKLKEFSPLIHKNLKTLKECRMGMQAICYKISLVEYEMNKIIL